MYTRPTEGGTEKKSLKPTALRFIIVSVCWLVLLLKQNTDLGQATISGSRLRLPKASWPVVVSGIFGLLLAMPEKQILVIYPCIRASKEVELVKIRLLRR